MVASVVRRGFAATRLADLTELSGVSTKSFYELFPDKDACFLATVEALIASVPEDADALALANWVAAQPAAATVCLVEAHAGAPEVRERLNSWIEGFEARARERLPDGSGFPREMFTAYVGALLEIARQRLRRGDEAELPQLFEQLSPLLIESYPPPPETLRLTSHRYSNGEEPLDATDHAERILQALTLEAAEEGYVRTTIDQIVKRAGVSPSMFYNHFPSKDEALLAAIDGAGARLVAGVMPAFRRAPEWPYGVNIAMKALFNQLAARPALAQLLMVEVYAAGPGALERRDEALRPLEGIWLAACRQWPQTPNLLFDAIQGGVYRLAYQRLTDRGPAALRTLAPIAAYLVLAPFLGAEEACRSAKAEPRPSSAKMRDPEAVRETALMPLRHKVYIRLGQEPLTLGRVAADLECPEDLIRHHLQALEKADMIGRLSGPDADGEVLYRSHGGEISDAESRRLSLSERQQMSDLIRELIKADLDLSIESGRFDSRPERAFIRLPLTVDEQGFQELSHLHTRALAAGREIEARAKERMQKSGETGIEVRHVLAMFEMPPAAPDEEEPT
jgi:AcrR family transcriptional regulator